MRISVALATYNGERFLAEQLGSILAQERVPDEVVIRDDGSSDNTQRIVETFTRAFPGTVDFAVNPIRLGVAGNFETALKATTGELVLLSDQDDRWHPHRVAQAERAFSADPELLLLFANARLVDAEGRPLGMTQMQALGLTASEQSRLRSGHAFEALSIRSLVLGASACLRRTVIADALPIPPLWMHDEWIALICAAKGGVAYVDQPVIDYRQHGSNVVGRPPLTLRELLADVLAPARDICAERVLREESLIERLRAIGASSTRLALHAEILVHARIRNALPVWRLLRLASILREATTGRYGRCSTGWRAMMFDMLRPIRRGST